jgi:hypothetical protein
VPDTKAASALAALAAEKPATLMAQLRAVWPQVEKALQMGHTLRVIHECLVQGGIPISYRRLTVYRGRIQRGKRPIGQSVRDSRIATAPQPVAERQPPSVQKPFESLANLHKQMERERRNWTFPTGPLDESKLI